MTTNEMPEVNAKIKELINERSKGVISRFAKQIGLDSPQIIGRLFIIDPRNGKYPEPSLGIIKKILSTFPDLNSGWFGIGELVDENKKPFTITQVNFDNYMEVTYLPVVAQAGYLNGFYDIKENIEQLETMLVPKEFENGNYLVVEISGDSMNDGTTRGICDGDKLLLKELDRDAWKGKLYFRQNLFVIMSDEGIVCKQILEHNTETLEVVCHSWNENYPNYTINLNDVSKLFCVKKLVERRIKF